jgi:hypothetical protein
MHPTSHEPFVDLFRQALPVTAPPPTFFETHSWPTGHIPSANGEQLRTKTIEVEGGPKFDFDTAEHEMVAMKDYKEGPCQAPKFAFPNFN